MYIIKNKIAFVALCCIFSSASQASELLGDWCENGGPYLCYPPIDNKNSEYVCIDGTSVTKAEDNHIVFVTRQTIHYYSDGFKNGKTKTQTIKNIFKRHSENGSDHYELTEDNREQETHKQLRIKGDLLQISFSKKSADSDKPVVVGKINYQRCSDDPNKKTFYTALVDCGGSGDYIAGVPAVVNNPLIWDLGEKSKINKSRCQVAARCWGGGWVAYAVSEQDSDSDKAAFGAACGTDNRHEAKQQAINSCRESGGSNCLSRVVSGYDNGGNELDDTAHKGTKVETCSYGNCQLISSN